jgi:phenylalanyl-tRNA synthetase beta chain
MHQEQKIGVAGMLDSTFYGSVINGDAFGFELDAQFLQSYRAPVPQYKPASKYPVVHRDLSMLVPLSLTVDDISTKIMNVDARIGRVLLLDYFEKDEWKDRKSLTFSLEISDHAKTLTTQEIDTIMEQVTEQVKKLGATIR